MSTSALTAGLSVSLVLAGVAAGQTSSSAAIDADVWTPVAASVVNDDIGAMGRVYHADAILVTAEVTRRISEALAGRRP